MTSIEIDKEIERVEALTDRVAELERSRRGPGRARSAASEGSAAARSGACGAG